MPTEFIEFAELIRTAFLVGVVGVILGFVILTVAVVLYWIVDGILFVLVCGVLIVVERLGYR